MRNADVFKQPLIYQLSTQSTDEKQIYDLALGLKYSKDKTRLNFSGFARFKSNCKGYCPKQGLELDSSSKNNRIGKDILHNEKKFYSVEARAISKMVIPGQWVNFTVDNVLKDSTSLLDGVKMVTNHDPREENIIGKLSNPYWQEKSNNIPPGINTTNLIPYGQGYVDSKGVKHTTDELIEKVENGTLDSQSVSVYFDWIQSHPEMDIYTFYENLGYEIEGKLVTIDIAKIHYYTENSWVYNGADPFAGTKIINKDTLVKSFSEVYNDSAIKSFKFSKPYILKGCEEFSQKDASYLNTSNNDRPIIKLNEKIKALEEEVQSYRDEKLKVLETLILKWNENYFEKAKSVIESFQSAAMDDIIDAIGIYEKRLNQVKSINTINSNSIEQIFVEDKMIKKLNYELKKSNVEMN